MDGRSRTMPDLAADAHRAFRALAVPARSARRRRSGPARFQFGGLCDRGGGARAGRRPRGAVPHGGRCGQGRFGTPPLHASTPTGLPTGLPGDHLHGPLFPDLDDGIEAFAAALADHFAPARASASTTRRMRCCGPYRSSTGSMLPMWSAPRSSPRHPDEIACIRNAQRLNELAMTDALAILRPGVRQTDLSAVFLRRVFELGASANGIDPIWQVMAPTRELGPWTLHGDLAYPTVTTDRFLREGDVIWVDCGDHLAGICL